MKKNKKPLIVISNDDGIKANGLRALYDELVKFADVIVAAPDSERSGASHSITISNRIRVRKVRFAKSYGYEVSGTPADCVKLALYNICTRKPDLVVTGINHGPNYGMFIIYSGTVGAATEAALLGIPAIAVSMDEFSVNADFGHAAVFAAGVARQVLDKKLKIKKFTLLNINVPGKPGLIKGVKILPRNTDQFVEKYVEKKHKGTVYYYWHIADRIATGKGISDVDAVEKGYITITPLSFDLTDMVFLKELKRKSGGLRIK
jgi:5'-nucleotidase